MPKLPKQYVTATTTISQVEERFPSFGDSSTLVENNTIWVVNVSRQ